MRILLLTTKLNVLTAGGSVHDIDSKAKILQNLGHDVSVITTFPQNNAWESPPPYRVIAEPVDARKSWRIQRDIVRMLRRHEDETDIYYVEGQFSIGAGLYRMAGGRRPVLGFFNVELSPWLYETRHGASMAFRFKTWVRRQIEWVQLRLCSSQLDHYLFTAPTVKAVLEAMGLRGEPCTIMPDFIDPEQLYASVGITHPDTGSKGIQKETFTVVCSGRMIPEKGFELALHAIANLPPDVRPRFRLMLCGGGPEEKRLQELIQRLGIEAYVSMPGWLTREQLFAILRSADVFILPRWRPHLTSVLLLEAMAFAIPCLVPAGGGLDWLADGGAETFRPFDAADLASKLVALAEQPERRIELARGCLRRVDQFNAKRMGAELSQLMQNLVLISGGPERPGTHGGA